MKSEHAIDWRKTAAEIESDYEAACKERDEMRAAAAKREWTAIDYAPHDRRILVKSESGEIYAAHWVQCPMTGDEAFCVSEAPDGTQHLVRPVEWREI